MAYDRDSDDVEINYDDDVWYFELYSKLIALYKLSPLKMIWIPLTVT
jgi:hypothetical protein